MNGQITVPQIPRLGRGSGRRANGRTRGDLLPREHARLAALRTTPRMPLHAAPFARFRPQAQGRTSEALARERLHPAAFPLSGQHASYLPFMACQVIRIWFIAYAAARQESIAASWEKHAHHDLSLLMARAVISESHLLGPSAAAPFVKNEQDDR